MPAARYGALAVNDTHPKVPMNVEKDEHGGI